MTLWLLVCATVVVNAGQAAHHWVPVVDWLTKTHPIEPGSPAFWHAYLQVYHWAGVTSVAAAVGLVSVVGVVLHAQGRAVPLIRTRRIAWLGLWTGGLLLCGVAAGQELTTASDLAGRGVLTAAFRQAYLQFHLWAVLTCVVVLVGLLGVSVALRRVVTLWPFCWASVAILCALGSLYWLTLAGQAGPAQMGPDSAAFWHPYLRFRFWGLLAYVATLVGALGVSVALQRVVTLWPLACVSVALGFIVPAWNGLYNTGAIGYSRESLGRSSFWDHYTQFHQAVVVSYVALLVSLVGAGAAVLYANGGWLVARPRQPMAERAEGQPASAQMPPPRPFGVTALAGIYLLTSPLLLVSLLTQQTPQVVLALPLNVTLGTGLLRQTRWGWELGMLCFGSSVVLIWVTPLLPPALHPWTQGNALFAHLVVLYLWSARRAFG
jgi:hypothetical protein